MVKGLSLACAAAIIVASPAIAEKGGKGHGRGQARPGLERQDWTKQVARSAKPIKRRAAMKRLRDRNRNLIDDRDEVPRREYGGALCPPGLLKKTPSCLPPGQAQRK
jgi:hypothetical protein